MREFGLIIACFLTLGATSPSGSPVVAEEDCRSFNWGIIAGDVARINVRQCRSHTVFEFTDVLGWDRGSPITVTHDSIEVPNAPDQWITRCGVLAEYAEDLSAIPGVVVVVQRPVNYSSPEILKAWMANLETWRLEPIDMAGKRCFLFPPID